MRATLTVEIRELLDDGRPRTAYEIATSVCARRVDVEQALAGGAFTEAVRPEGANPRATYWKNASVSSRPVPAALKGMGRAARMLAVLRDGREHSREEILQLSPGSFFLTNNAASDLRGKGYDVRHVVREGSHIYQLVGLLEEPAGRPQQLPAGSSSGTPLEGTDDDAPGSGALVSRHARPSSVPSSGEPAPLPGMEPPARGAYSEPEAA